MSADQPPREPVPMTDDELRAELAREITAARGQWSSEMAQDRARLLREYHREKYGDEVDGYSQYVSGDTFEAVETMLPNLVETFVGGPEAVRVEPTDEDDEEQAEQASARLNHCFLRENNGFLLAYTGMKDALLQRSGVFKWYLEETSEFVEEAHSGLSIVELGLLMNDPSLRPTAYGPAGLGPMGPLADVIVERETKHKKVCIVAVAPERFGIDRDATSIDDARCVFEQEDMTVSAMREMGWDEDKIEACPDASQSWRTDSEEVQARRTLEGEDAFDGSPRGGSETLKEVFEVYIRIDTDGDGKSELRRIVCGGANAAVIFENSRVRTIPFSAATPIIVTHRFFGVSIGDALSDLQRLRTALTRMYLDGVYALSRPRTITLGDSTNGAQCDMDELMALRPGGNVTEYVAGAIRPFPVDPTGPQTVLEGLEYTRGLREERIGISRASTGLAGAAPDEMTTLHGTAKGLQMLQMAANKREALIARIFAECLFKPMFKGVYELLREVEEPATFKHKGAWQSVGPDAYEKKRECTLAVGLGYGDRRERLEGLMTIASLQERIGASPFGPLLLQPENVHALADDIAEAVGHRNEARYFSDPAKAPPQQPPPPDSWIVETASKERIETEKLRLKELELRFNHELELRKLGLAEAEAEREARETELPLTGSLTPGAQAQRAAEPGGVVQPNGGGPQ